MEKKLFLQIHRINIVDPNEENMIVVPITKRIEIIMSIQVCLITRMNIIIRKMVERKAFLANPKHQDRVPQYGEHDYRAHNKKNRDYYRYPSLSHFTDEH